MNEIVEINTEVVTLSKEEKLSNALSLVQNAKLQKMLIALYKHEIYEETTIENFQEDNYQDITYKTGYKGYRMMKDKEGNLFFVKSLSAEEGLETYAYQMLSFPNIEEEDKALLNEYLKPKKVAQWVFFGIFSFFLLIGVVAYFIFFFDNVQADFKNAFVISFTYCGGFVLIGFGQLVLILNRLLSKHSKERK